MDQKIVVHFLDGQIIKGHTFDFFHTRPVFHLKPAIGGPSASPVEVQIADLKAVFFVKDFEGNPSYNERKVFTAEDKAYGKKIGITFKDGEQLVGTCNAYNLASMGFFFFPIDPQSNNVRVFAVSSAIEKVDELSI